MKAKDTILRDKIFLELLRKEGMPKPEEQYKFSKTRRWRFDFAWPEKMLAVEIEGKVWGQYVYCHRCGAKVQKKSAGGKWSYVRDSGGRHTSASGYLGDMEKYNNAALLGWRLIRIPANDMHNKESVSIIKEAYNDFSNRN